MANMSLAQFKKKPAATGMMASSNTPRLRDYEQPVIRNPLTNIPTEQQPPAVPVVPPDKVPPTTGPVIREPITKMPVEQAPPALTPIQGGKDTIGPVIREPGTYEASPLPPPANTKPPTTTGPLDRTSGPFEASPIGTPIDPKVPTTTGPITPTTPPFNGSPTGQPALGDFFREVQQKELVATQLNDLLDSDSRYIQNARRRAMEQANSRGLLNSTASAGAAERAAIEAGMGIATADANAYRSSGDQNFAALSQLRQMRTSAELQDWSNSQQFNREFNAGLSLMPIQNATQMWNAIMERGLDDPAVFTPEVMQNLSDFYNLNFDVMMKRYLGGG